MRIKYLTGPRSGQIDHAPNSQETYLLVKAGILEEIPYKDFRERLREEGQGMQQPDPNFVQGVQWSVVKRPYGPVGKSVAFIERRSGTEKLCGESPDAFKDCPAAVREQWSALNKPENLGPTYDQRLQQQYRDEAVQKERDARGTGIALSIIGGSTTNPNPGAGK